MYKKNYRFLVMGLIFSALAVTGCSNNQKTEETVIESTANTEYESNEEAAGETVTEDETDDKSTKIMRNMKKTVRKVQKRHLRM